MCYNRIWVDVAIGDNMLKISDSFYKEEVRLGFTITETMKRAWSVQLEMLDAIMNIAQRHNISIWADYGTLLGSVRHKGFVPWDDDIDLCMFRKDYMAFHTILKEELSMAYKISSFYATDDYDQPNLLVTNRHHLDLGNNPHEKAITNMQHGCPYITGIDIFPLDYVPADAEQLNLISNLYISAYDLAFNFDYYRSTGELESNLLQLESLLSTKLERNDHLRSSIWKLADAIAMMTYENEATDIAHYSRCAVYGFHNTCKKSSYNKTVYLDFEMIQVPAPEGYDDVLSSLYGKDYMTPVPGIAWHTYPFYKVQDKRILFNSKLGQMGDIF